MIARIRAVREERGLSQDELARRAGLSRQQVGAMESRRHVPSVAAALAVARVLGTSVETLFGEDDHTVPVMAPGGAERPAPDPTPVRVGRVGESVVTATSNAGPLPEERWDMADGLLSAGAVELFPGAVPASLVVAGCDPLLGSLAESVERAGSHRVLAVHASTDRAVDSLRAERVHAVVVHGPAGTLAPPLDLAVARYRVAAWQAGLAATGTTPPSIDELAGRRARVLQREAGAATQAALVRALGAAGAGPLPGPVGSGHLDIARRVRSREARAGVTMEAAALAMHLAFTPLETHDVELWVGRRWLTTPAVAALLDTLTSAGFAARAATVPGYDLAGLGDLLPVAG